MCFSQLTLSYNEDIGHINGENYDGVIPVSKVKIILVSEVAKSVLR